MSELDKQLKTLADSIRAVVAPEEQGQLSLDDMARLLGEKEWKGEYFNLCKSIIERTATSLEVGTVGDYAFSNFESLVSVIIKYGTIGDWAFDRCSNLQSITIRKGVTKIGERAFCYCQSLKTITIPSTVTAILQQAFQGCSALTDINCCFEKDTVSGAPWGAPEKTQIHYGVTP